MITLTVSQRVQKTLYAGIILSLVTGIAFFILKTWITVEGDFGPEKHAWQFPILQIHAASAFFIMIMFGAFLGSHVQYGWRTGRSRKTGVTLLTALSVQISTAYMLYYLSNQSLRIVAEYTHLAIGTSIALLLIFHVKISRQAKRLRTRE
jgi:hypothetical protein